MHFLFSSLVPIIYVLMELPCIYLTTNSLFLVDRLFFCFMLYADRGLRRNVRIVKGLREKNMKGSESNIQLPSIGLILSELQDGVPCSNPGCFFNVGFPCNICKRVFIKIGYSLHKLKSKNFYN